MATAARARTSLLGTSPAEALTAFEEQDRREERGEDSHVDVDKMQQELVEKTQEFTNSLHQGREKAAENKTVLSGVGVTTCSEGMCGEGR